jgi:heme/copper-type cytochrome/quinol oxidase subunit 2
LYSARVTTLTLNNMSECGRNHSLMLFNVKVVTLAEYKAYLETIKGSQA